MSGSSSDPIILDSPQVDDRDEDSSSVQVLDDMGSSITQNPPAVNYSQQLQQEQHTTGTSTYRSGQSSDNLHGFQNNNIVKENPINRIQSDDYVAQEIIRCKARRQENNYFFSRFQSSVEVDKQQHQKISNSKGCTSRGVTKNDNYIHAKKMWFYRKIRNGGCKKQYLTIDWRRQANLSYLLLLQKLFGVQTCCIFLLKKYCYIRTSFTLKFPCKYITIKVNTTSLNHVIATSKSEMRRSYL